MKYQTSSGPFIKCQKHIIIEFLLESDLFTRNEYILYVENTEFSEVSKKLPYVP